MNIRLPMQGNEDSMKRIELPACWECNMDSGLWEFDCDQCNVDGMYNSDGSIRKDYV